MISSYQLNITYYLRDISHNISSEHDTVTLNWYEIIQTYKTYGSKSIFFRLLYNKTDFLNLLASNSYLTKSFSLSLILWLTEVKKNTAIFFGEDLYDWALQFTTEYVPVC